MDLYVTLVRFFQEGGAFMYPIAAVMAVGLAVALERWFYLLNQTRINRRDFQQILPLLREQRSRELADFVAGSSSAVSRIVADGLTRRTGSRRRADIEYAMEEGLLEVLPRIERRTGYLATFANIATLLGLLGTIIGLIAAFTAVANADPAEKATLLSQSISIAMNTTAFGPAEQDLPDRREPRDRHGEVPEPHGSAGPAEPRRDRNPLNPTARRSRE
jgi:biopolymer transport protein ExbB/TolQ